MAADERGPEPQQTPNDPCPRCGSYAVKPIVYGYPDPVSFATMQDEVVFAGCVIPENPPAPACGQCDGPWGRVAWLDDSASGSPVDELDE